VATFDHAGAGVRPEQWVSPTGRRRILTRLDGLEGRRYAAAVRAAFPDADLTLSALVFAGRSRPGGVRHPWPQEREAWRRAVRQVSRRAPLMAAADVRDCYPSIRERAVVAASRRVGGNPDLLLAHLRRYRDLGIDGLPVGPLASAVAANAVLAIADDAARTAGILPVRWVDDVVFAGARTDVARAHNAWRTALRELGLRDNEAKSRRFHDPDEAIESLHAGGSLAEARSRGIIRRS